MSDLKFFEEGYHTYCYIGSTKCRLIKVGSIGFLMPMSIVANEQLLQKAISLLEKQVALFDSMVRSGIPVEDAVKVLALGSLVTFEFSTDSAGNMLGLPRESRDC